MPLNNLEQVIFNLGSQLGEHLIAGFKQAMARNPIAVGGARSRTGAALLGRSSGCIVPGCRSQAKSTQLCGKHYQKARRNKLDGNHLTDQQMEFLAQDGRALRFAKPGSAQASLRLAQTAKAAGHPRGSKQSCIVPGCSGIAASNHLCPRHYQKSRRSGFIGKKLTMDQLEFLAQDGRAHRFGKSGADVAKGARKGPRAAAARRARAGTRKS